MKKHGGFLLALIAAVVLTPLCGCAKEGVQSSASTLPPASQAQTETISSLSGMPQNSAGASEPVVAGEVIVTFDYQRQSGYASNQFAVWIENAEGNLIKTLHVTRFTAKGGYKNRPDAIPAWVEKSGLSTMTRTEVDAVAGATPKAGTLSYKWDLTDVNGNAVPPGAYTFFVEGSLRWKNRVLYSGVIAAGDNRSTADGVAEYFYEASDSQPALSGDSPENSMIGTVTASFAPSADS